MYCPSCGNEITVELKYCNRCGANLSLPTTQFVPPAPTPVKLTGPTLILGLTITGSLGIVFAALVQLAAMGVHPAVLGSIVLFSMATLFGCTGLLIRFWSAMVTIQRESVPPQAFSRQPKIERANPPQLPPRFEAGASVTDNTTRTFAPRFKEPEDR